MRLLKQAMVTVALIAGVSILPSFAVKAEATYGTSDIERIYIYCDKDINQLIKDDVINEVDNSVIEKAYQTAKVVVVAKDGTEELVDEAASVKLRGNSTSKAEKKPLKLKFSKKQSLFGMEESKKWNLLANAFDKSLIRNRLAFDLAANLGLRYTSESEFIDLYYNDVLQGSYLVTESVEAGKGQVEINNDELTSDFMIERENERNEEGVTYVYTKDNVRFAVNEPEKPTATQLKNIQTFINNAETAFKSGDYDKFIKYIDIDSFVDYYIVSEIFKAVDFNYSSTRFYVKDGKMYAGPIWDVDLSSGNASARFYRAYDNNGKSYEKLFCSEFKWYGYLLKSDKFVNKLTQRVSYCKPMLERLYKSSDGSKSDIDVLLEKYGKSFARNYASKENGGAGWSITKRYSICDNRIGLEYDNPADTYEGNVELLRTWLSKRVPYVIREWKAIKNNKITGFSAKKASATKIKLTWTTTGCADGYEITVKKPLCLFGGSKIVNNRNTKQYVYSGLKTGLSYKFRIRSFIIDDGKKVYSSYKEISYKIPLSSAKVKASIKGKKLTIKWNKISGASGYEVYVKAGNGKFKKVKTISGNKTIKYVYKKCKKGVKYQVKVKPFVKWMGKKYYA